MLRELGRHLGCAARLRARCGLAHRRCARRVRPVRSEREVACALLRIPNELSEATMENPPRSRADTPIRYGREQWMRESDPAMLEREHAVRERGLEQLLLDE